MFQLLRSACLALLGISNSQTILAPPARLIYQFPPNVDAENIACRANGELLLSIVNEPIVYTLNPMQPSPQPEIIFQFPNATGMTGLAETNVPDVFAVVAGNWSGFGGVAGTFAVWSLDLRAYPYNVTRLAIIPQAIGVNGLAVVQDETGTILTADTEQGVIYGFDPSKPTPTVAISHTMLQPPPTSPPPERIPFGVNGINVRKSSNGQFTLYFANSGKNIYGAQQIRPNGQPQGQPRKLAELPIPDTYDDFAMDSQGSAILAAHPNSTYRVKLDGTVTLFQRSPQLVEPTSSIFGRGSLKEENTLYFSTGGTEGGGGAGGQVIAFDDYSPNLWMDDEGYMHKAEATAEEGSARDSWLSSVEQHVVGPKVRNYLA